MEVGGFDGLEVDRGRPARGRLLRAPTSAAGDPPLFDDVRRASVRQPRRAVPRRPGATRRTSRDLALGLFDELAAAGAARGRPGRARAAVGRGAAARHRHDRRLRRPPQALALPGPQRRAARLRRRARSRSSRQAARYHRKGMPALGPFAPLCDKGDEERLNRMRDAAAPGRGPRALARPARARGPRRRRGRHGRASSSSPTATTASRAGPPGARRPLRARLRSSADGLAARASSAGGR